MSSIAIALPPQTGNVLLAGGEDMGDLSRAVAALCGVDYDSKGSRVVDHFASVEADVLGEVGGTG